MAADGRAATRPLTKFTRSVEILRILLGHDFLSLARSVAHAVRKAAPGREPEYPHELPQQVRRLLEDLGPTFIKLGQLLGTRPDLIPKAFAEEFRHLYDRTKPAPFPDVRRLLEGELGASLGEVFTEFDETPLASASIGQVHRGRLSSGEIVAVKVQRPGIEERVHLDFAILRPIITFIERLFAASRIWQPTQHLDEIEEMLRRELDYTNEAKNHERVYRNFRDVKDVVIPRIFHDRSTRRVLTLEFIHGAKLSNLSDPGLSRVDGPAVARTITHAMAKQIFVDRIFHADPSPGNLLVVGDRTVAFLDFGAVGKVTRRRSERILRLIRGFVQNDLEAVVGSLLDLCNARGDVDMKGLSRDVEKIMDHHEAERASVADPVVLDMILQTAGRHNLLLPPDFLLITRALFQFDGLCKKLDPHYELVDVLAPFIRDTMTKEAFDPAKQKEILMDTALRYVDALRAFPARVDHILTKLESNELAIQLETRGTAEIKRAADRRTVLGSFTAVVAALVVGLALAFATGRGPALEGFGFFAFLFVALWAVVVLAFWSD